MFARYLVTAFSALLCVNAVCMAQTQGAAPDDSLQGTLKDGDSALARGEYESARHSFETAWQIAQRLPPAAAARYDVLKRLVAVSASSGNFGEAEGYLLQAIAWRESTASAQDPRLADDLLLSIHLDLRTKKFDRALGTAQRLQAMHIAANGAESLPAADDLLRTGQIYLAEGQARDAARSLAAAAALRMKLAGSLDPGLLPILDGLAKSFDEIAGGRPAGNETVYRQALTIRETLYGEDSSELISTVEALADAYAAAGEYSAAEPVYERLLSLWEKLVGRDHPMIAVTLDKLVVFYTNEDKPDKARAALARSVAIRARFLAVGLSLQAADELKEGRPKQAQVLYRRALAALGPGTPADGDLIGKISKALGDIDRRAGK